MNIFPADPMVPVPFRVTANTKEMAGTRTLVLEGENGGARFAPGQFMMVYAFGIGEIPLSISGDPKEPGRLVHTVREVGAVSAGICAAKKGGVLGVRGPFGTSWPLEEVRGRDVVFVAGGLGLAPLRPAVYAILADREAYGRVTLFYGAREPELILYRKELERWRSRFDLDVRVTVDGAGPDWRGHVGTVTSLFSDGAYDPERTEAFLCGPEIMMRYGMKELLRRGVRPDRMHLSMERNMKCAVGFCGHCQLGPEFICKDGPVFPYSRLERFLAVREL